MTTNAVWAILHISDTQFGRYHRFRGHDDELATRLLDDIAVVRDQVPPIRLIAWTGDISERALPVEYKQAQSFIGKLREQLGLSSEDVLAVPGNHDVNWKDCEAYFNRREASGLTPTPPFATKWNKYRTFVRSTGLGGELSQVVDRPDLGATIALVNSTIRESHLEHYGWAGEAQLRNLSGEMKASPHHIRIALLHHNVRRRAVSDDENLFDEDDFTRILGPNLDIVLHGHTHDGRRDFLSDGTLVLSTGSAAVNADYRPEEVSNQYQIVGIGAEVVVRWARRYEPSERRFVADSRVGDEANPGRETIALPGRPSARFSDTAKRRLGLYDELH